MNWSDVTSSVVHGAVDRLRAEPALVVGDGDEPDGVLTGDDPKPGYGHPDPPQFFTFARMGVDGVHYGLWVDAVDQAHEPCVVQYSPFDAEQLHPMAVDTADWLGRRRIEAEDEDAVDGDEYSDRVTARRDELGLPPLPQTFGEATS